MLCNFAFKGVSEAVSEPSNGQATSIMYTVFPTLAVISGRRLVSQTFWLTDKMVVLCLESFNNSIGNGIMLELPTMRVERAMVYHTRKSLNPLFKSPTHSVIIFQG
ncbi:hypothetical protein CDAR_188971 [Caerostris darwini]|uniref:Uncharacterized protein n=1 Tax=Caerostris darwini TaxID=1538125 RepID=A0AAV4QRG8_9ARAC|nr:hypothetical protein CDAR_188971 [Caerostris darwini]